MYELVPVAGATAKGRRPRTAMTARAGTLTVTDHASGATATVTPAGLYSYGYERAGSRGLRGVAALDADGLVLLDLPGGWNVADLKDFAEQARIPVSESRHQSADRVRVCLAARAPGRRRLSGLARGQGFTRRRKAATVCAGAAGLAVMALLSANGMGFAWRGMSTLGRFLVELLEAKWLFLGFFSPALLMSRPISARVHRWRARRGSIAGPVSGPCLVGRQPCKLEIVQGDRPLATMRRGREPGQAAGLLLYRHEDLRGLFIQDSLGIPLHHLPGPWSPDELDRFARRNDLTLAVLALTRDEYLNLAGSARSATP
ncbi:hypothetical protein [Nonomuraea sp. NPDC050783]|uniref:hypothetical protein n=1 Tax=Nonomuraea sp. NPDC050783 TaxID=3154634 RepID=UPI003466F6A9